MNKRRKLLLALSGVSATTVWAKPVVDAVMLPVHAETTEPTTPTPTPTPTPEPTEPTGVVEWRLDNVNFSVHEGGGGAASGSFTYDHTNNTVTAWDIEVSGGDTTRYPEIRYTMENSTFDDLISASVTISLTGSSPLREIRLTTESPLTSVGGTLLLILPPDGDGFEANGLDFRLMDSGSLVGRIVERV